MIYLFISLNFINLENKGVYRIDDVEIVKDENNERHTEPASIEQENVHIADVISEFHPEYSGRQMGTVPEIAGKIVYGEVKVNRENPDN